LWVVSSIAWMLYVFVAADVPEKIAYAWRYYTDYEGLQKEADKPQAAPVDYLRMMEESLGSLPQDQVDPYRAAMERDLSVLLAAAEADPAAARREATVRQVEGAVPASPAPKTTFTDADFVQLLQPAKPEWKWLAAMFLPPTVGVFMAWMLLHMALKTCRWVWLGFKD
jgi:hypothetical protein